MLKKVKRIKIISNEYPAGQAAAHDPQANAVSDFVDKHTVRDVTWVQSTGLANGSWMTTVLTAIISYEEEIEVAAPPADKK